VRAGPADRDALRDRARGAGDRRHDRHRFDRDHSGRPPAERNGYVFHHTDNLAIESALGRALRLWFARPREFRSLAANCMHADYSWRRPGQDYLDIYGHVQHR
jgi:starch synthase